jgi:hypothetical protein
MYITNPSESDLARWYSCKKQTADYLVYHRMLNFIYTNDKRVYFTRTVRLESEVKKLPLLYKILEMF